MADVDPSADVDPLADVSLSVDAEPFGCPRAQTHLGLPPVLHINTRDDEDAEAWSRRLSTALDLDVVLAAHDAALSKRGRASSSATGLGGYASQLVCAQKRRNTWGYYPIAMNLPTEASVIDRGRYRTLSWEAISPMTLVEGEKGTIPAAALVCGRCGASGAASIKSFETAREYSNDAAEEQLVVAAEGDSSTAILDKPANRLDSGV